MRSTRTGGLLCNCNQHVATHPLSERCTFRLLIHRAVGLEANWAAYVLLVGWAVLGCGYYLLQRLRIRASRAAVKVTSG